MKLSDLYCALHARVHPGACMAVEWLLLSNNEMRPVAALHMVVPVNKGAANDATREAEPQQ